MVADNPGSDADAPSEIPVRAWREVWRRAIYRAFDEGLLTEAAGVAFYAVFALFAGLAAFVSFWGMLADPAALGRRVRAVGDALPVGLPEVLEQLLGEATAPGRGAAALAAALWSASGAAQALIRGLNLAYGERECRGTWRLTGVSLMVALCVALFALLTLAAFLTLPLVASDGAIGTILQALRWPALLVAAGCGVAVLYRAVPCRTEPRWRWVSWGSGFAAIAWVGGSAGFSWYARHLGGYGVAYGPLAAVISFMTWAWLSAAALLLGALLNAEAECQTRRDTTAGPAAPLGSRGAAKADLVA